MINDYEVAEHPPARPSRDEVTAHARDELKALLAGPGDDEAPFHRHLERFPLLVPRMGHLGHHGAVRSLFYTESYLPGASHKRPDVMWMTTDTSGVRITMVELEAPSKRLFRADGRPSAKFTEARNQITEWMTWQAEPANVDLFRDAYRLDEWPTRGRHLDFNYLLIYGRGGEYADNGTLLRRRRTLATNEANFTLASWDSLLESEGHARDGLLTVRASPKGLKAVYATDRLMVGTSTGADWGSIAGIDDAIRSNDSLMSRDRKAFLLERLNYWLQWHRSRSPGGIMAHSE